MYKQSFKDIIKNTGVMFGKVNGTNKEKNKIIENSISALKSVLSDLHGVDMKKFDFVLSSENLKILNKLDI